MAKLIKDFNNVLVEDGKVQIPNYWSGVGWALIPIDWVIRLGQCEKLEKVVLIGERTFRILYVGKGDPFYPNLYIIQANNHRWPIWWVLCRLWQFVCWFELNLRLTATVWGFLRSDLGCYPRWRDFVLLRRRK